MPKRKVTQLVCGHISKAHSATENTAWGGKAGRRPPDIRGVDEVAILVGAVVSWHPGTSLLLGGSASAWPHTATRGEKYIPGEAFHQSGCYLKDDVTANDLLLLPSSRTAERPLPASTEQ